MGYGYFLLVELRFDPGTGEAPERIDDTEGEQLLEVSEKDGPLLCENLLANKASCIAKSNSRLHPVNRISTLSINELLFTASNILTAPSTFKAFVEIFRFLSPGDLLSI